MIWISRIFVFPWFLFDNSGRLGLPGMIHVPGISESPARVVLSPVQVRYFNPKPGESGKAERNIVGHRGVV